MEKALKNNETIKGPDVGFLGKIDEDLRAVAYVTWMKMEADKSINVRDFNPQG